MVLALATTAVMFYNSNGQHGRRATGGHAEAKLQRPRPFDWQLQVLGSVLSDVEKELITSANADELMEISEAELEAAIADTTGMPEPEREARVHVAHARRQSSCHDGVFSFPKDALYFGRAFLRNGYCATHKLSHLSVRGSQRLLGVAGSDLSLSLSL